MIILIKLIIAHFIGDFLLQPKSWVEEKGLDYNHACQVVSDRYKGSRGKSRIILQHLQRLVAESA